MESTHLSAFMVHSQWNLHQSVGSSSMFQLQTSQNCFLSIGPTVHAWYFRLFASTRTIHHRGVYILEACYLGDFPGNKTLNSYAMSPSAKLSVKTFIVRKQKTDIALSISDVLYMLVALRWRENVDWYTANRSDRK
jgi:hypothetical protein